MWELKLLQLGCKKVLNEDSQPAGVMGKDVGCWFWREMSKSPPPPEDQMKSNELHVQHTSEKHARTPAMNPFSSDSVKTGIYFCLLASIRAGRRRVDCSSK